MVWGLVARGLLGRAFAGSAARTAAPAAASSSGFLSRAFGFGVNRPGVTVAAGLGIDQAATGGAGRTALFNMASGALMPRTPADWIKYGAFAMATLNVAQGNMVAGAAYGALGYYMNDIVNSQFVQSILNSDTFKSVLQSIDEFTNNNIGVDIIPDEWHTPAPAAPAPAM